jgi:hypothetical protein
MYGLLLEILVHWTKCLHTSVFASPLFPVLNLIVHFFSDVL